MPSAMSTTTNIPETTYSHVSDLAEAFCGVSVFCLTMTKIISYNEVTPENFYILRGVFFSQNNVYLLVPVK